MGFIVLGIFALNSTALDGASVQMLNHGLTTGALFACVGMIYERYHTRDMNQIGGLWNRLPILAFFLMLAAFGSAAVPGLNGFVGEFPILVGTFATSPRAGVLAATGMVLGACYLFWMLRKILFGPLLEPVPHAAEGEPITGAALGHTAVPPVGVHEIAGLAPLMFLIVVIGVYPRPVLEQMRPTLALIDRTTQAARGIEIKTSDAGAKAREGLRCRRRGLKGESRWPGGPRAARLIVAEAAGHEFRLFAVCCSEDRARLASRADLARERDRDDDGIGFHRAPRCFCS